MTTQQTLSPALQCGKCYIVRGDVASIDGASITIQIGFDNGVTFTAQDDEIVISSTGLFSETINTAECREGAQVQQPNAIRISSTDDFSVTLESVELSEACQIELCSECLELQPADCFGGVILEYSHDSDAFGLIYENLPDFKQYLALPGKTFAADYPYPTEEDFKYPNGHKIPTKTDSEKTEVLAIEEVPEWVHDAIRLALKHENLTINNEPYFKLNGSYSPEFDREMSLAAGVEVDVQRLPQRKKADF